MTPRKLASAIRKGHTMIGESRWNYYNYKCGCVIGAALAGAHIPVEVWRREITLRNIFKKNFYETRAAQLLQINSNLCILIAEMHLEQKISRLAIADWLDTLEPETKPANKQTFEQFMATAMMPIFEQCEKEKR